jgi:hypothetical protein
MKKIAQSILDFLNIFPKEILKAPRTTLSSREAETLFSIWKSNRDEHGRPILVGADSLIIAALVTKGMIKNNPPTISEEDAIEITPAGREIIRKIILSSEQSKFSNIQSNNTMVNGDNKNRKIAWSMNYED